MKRLPVDIPGNIKALREIAEVANQRRLRPCSDLHDTLDARMAGYLDEALDMCEALIAQVNAVKYSVVDTIGGVDEEGYATSEVNYLQRLRILVKNEQALFTLINSEPPEPKVRA